MKYTENYGLKKPETTDFYNVDDFNENMDKIEEEFNKRPTDDGDASSMTIKFTEASATATLSSGEKLNILLGKIAKTVKDFISHIATKATTSVLGHVKLSDSSSVTNSAGLALPATEKNASIEGTLANQISKKANASHTHTKSQIADFPSTMPTVVTTKTLSYDNISIAAGSFTDVTISLPTVSGYTFVGVTQWYLMNASTNGAAANGCIIGTLGDTYVRIRNFANSTTAKVKLILILKYVKTS